MFKKTLLAAALTLAAVGTASACSTLIIGKAVSETGNIIVAHNEDNGGRLFNMQHYMPPAKHKSGEMLKFEKFAAAIPQVEETLGFYWTQTFVPDGASFADGFFNDAGVAVATNWCGEIFDADRMEVKDGGIGYGIRRLIAERAHSAREGVDIAIKLLNEYGYFHEGRTYTIADAKEAWQIAIHQGNSWAAHKVRDDEVVYIPNAFSMDKVDLNDKEHWLVEPKQVERAVKDGRHKAGDPIFNWRKVVAQQSVRHERWNANRNVIAWKFLTGKELNDPEQFPYSVTVDRKLGVSDAMAFL
ncbi:MAG: C69 family dipeptidase, partial [Sutterella sp.]